MPTIEELKIYIGIDGSHLDSLLADFLNTAKELVEKVLRAPVETYNPTPATIKEALKYAVAFLYTGRESANIAQLEQMLASMLGAIRKQVF